MHPIDAICMCGMRIQCITFSEKAISTVEFKETTPEHNIQHSMVY